MDAIEIAPVIFHDLLDWEINLPNKKTIIELINDRAHLCDYLLHFRTVGRIERKEGVVGSQPAWYPRLGRACDRCENYPPWFAYPTLRTAPLANLEIANLSRHKGILGKKGCGVNERNISRVIHGVTLRGTYAVQGGVVTVRTHLGSKSTHALRGSKASSLAYVMLGELYHEMSALSSDRTMEQ